MAKTTFAEFSTTPADNTDVNGIGVQGTNIVQNFDNAFRELMAILRRDVPGLALANTFTKTQTWTKGTDVASASSLALGDGNYFDVTGTTSITSIGTKGVGTVVVLQFDAALTLTHNATDLILPSGANITTAAGDHAAFVEYATGDWRCFCYQRANGEPLVVLPENWVDVASATTTDIGAAASQNVRITGTTTITGLGTVTAGTFRRVRFAGILTLTHNGTSLILPGSANITTVAGDVGEFISEGSGNWRCVDYTKASGLGLSSSEILSLFNASGLAPVAAARAKGYFNGTATTPVPGAGGINFASITDRGAGLYTVNLTTAMPSTEYAVLISSDEVQTFEDASVTRTTTAFGIRVRNSASANADARVSFAVL